LLDLGKVRVGREFTRAYLVNARPLPQRTRPPSANDFRY
jgi:hypothetical protein